MPMAISRRTDGIADAPQKCRRGIAFIGWGNGLACPRLIEWCTHVAALYLFDLSQTDCGTSRFGRQKVMPIRQSKIMKLGRSPLRLIVRLM